MTSPGKWAVTLRRSAEERLEDRLVPIVKHLPERARSGLWLISDLDATGPRGGSLSRRLNEEGSFHLSPKELLEILQEDGQILELNATLQSGNRPLFRLIVRDGASIDVLGSGSFLLPAVLGQYDAMDPELFLW